VTLAPATLTPLPSPVPPSPTPPPAASPTAPTATAAATATAPAAAASPRPSPTATPDPALSTILDYLEARAAADVTRVTDLSCAAWKPQAVTEAVSFRSMNARLQDAVCRVAGTDGAFTLVTCDGKIITTYGPESREWDLSTLIYQAAPEDGQWKMCGYH
jgi:hypothetical protein